MTNKEDIQKIIIGSNVTSINDNGFNGLTTLQSVIIPNSVTYIGYNSFNSCAALQSVTIPDSVTNIGSSAFNSCAALQSVTIPDSVTSIGNYAFSGCSALQSVTIPDSVTSIGASVFSVCIELQSVTIPDSVTSIGVRAFQSCSALQSVTIPDSVTSISEYAFSYCSALQSVIIPDSVTYLAQRVFQNCDSLQSVTIGDSVTNIEYRTFYNCSALQSVTIGSSVTIIRDKAFQSCTALLSITIPDSVTSIEANAFVNTILTRVNMSETVKTRLNVEYGLNTAFYGANNVFILDIGVEVTGPIGLIISNSIIHENIIDGTVVGNFTTIDPFSSINDTFNYILNSTDGPFEIDDNDNLIKTTGSINYDTKNLYTINVTTSDTNGLSYTTDIIISVMKLKFSGNNTSVDENVSIGYVLGQFTTIDPSISNNFVYTIDTSGNGVPFEFEGDILKTSVELDYEAQTLYTFDVTSTDQLNTIVGTFTIYINDTFDAPNNITLTNNNVNENASVGTEIGILTASDQDSDTFTYEIDTSSDVVPFVIDGNKLKTNNVLDYNVATSYNITVIATDNTDLTYSKDFIIYINNINDSPTDILLSNANVDENKGCRYGSRYIYNK